MNWQILSMILAIGVPFIAVIMVPLFKTESRLKLVTNTALSSHTFNDNGNVGSLLLIKYWVYGLEFLTIVCPQRSLFSIQAVLFLNSDSVSES